MGKPASKVPFQSLSREFFDPLTYFTSWRVVLTILVLTIAVSGWLVLPYASKKLQIHHLRRRCQAARLIVLTYDDGPGALLTPALLDILRDRNATATFFLLGHKLNGSKAIVAEIKKAGHELGSHSYEHLHAWKRNPISVFRDIQEGLRAVRTVAECHLFRAPYGKLTLGSMIQVRLQGCMQSWWTIDSSDTWTTPMPVERVISKIRREGGGVVLMHDHDRPNSPEREEYVLDLTRTVLELARKEGFSICRMGDIYGEDRRARLPKS
jgi:peptidoglycan/xylan/chitin deacetylase (PgdA/CDA1 family)